MKKKLLIALSFITCLGIAFIPEQDIHGYGSYGPPGFVGSPFDGTTKTCGSGGGCHAGGSTVIPTIITTNIPACGYSPGQTYNISVTATSPGRSKFGFSFSAQKTSDGVTAGTLISTTGLQLNGSNRFITHTSTSNAATSTDTRVWNFQWTAPVTGTGSVTLYAVVNCTNANGGSGGDIVFNSSIAISEGTPPTAPIISANGSTTICAGQSVTLNSNTATGISWSNGANTQSINISTAGNYSTTVTGACGTATSNTISVIVNEPPAAPVVTPGANGLQFCEGLSTTLNATSLLPVVWNPGNLTTNQIIVNTEGTYSASATNSCGTTSSLPVEIIIIPIPTPADVSLNADTTFFCEGDSVELISSTNFSLNWSPVNISSPSIFASSPGEYFVTTSNECGTSNSDTLIILSETIPNAPQIIFNGNDSIFSSVVGQNYNWFLNGNPIKINQNGILLSDEGNYTVSLSTNNGCTSTVSDVFVYDASNIIENLSFEVKIFPNPIAQNGNITIQGKTFEDNFIEIFDLQGRLVFRTSANQKTFQVPLDRGTYILSIGTLRRKIIIQ